MRTLERASTPARCRELLRIVGRVMRDVEGNLDRSCFPCVRNLVEGTDLALTLKNR